MKTFSDYEIDLPDFFHGERATTCPKCSADRKKPLNKCLSVNGDKRTWHCFNCGWSGKLPTDESAAPVKAYKRPEPPKPDKIPELDTRVLDYFKNKRGISAETLKKAGIYSTYHYLPGTGAETLCMAFPYYRNGELVNVKYRDANKNMAQEKDPEPCLWNIDGCAGSNIIYITEGELDALTLIECGFTPAVSVDKGAPQPSDKNADKKLSCVTNCLPLLEKVETVVLVTDKDAPGARLEKELITRFGAARCKVVVYPEGCKDINDVLVKFGPKAVMEAVLSASPVPVPGLRAVSDYAGKLAEYWRKGKPKGLSTGWREFDQIFTVQPGSVNVITGIPTSGKSEFLHQLLVNFMHFHNWNCAIFSPEMMPVENLLSNFAEKIVGKPFFGHPEYRMSDGEQRGAMEYLNKHLQIIATEMGVTPDIDWLLSVAKVCIERHGCKAIAIDPYNELDHMRKEWVTENEYVSAFMSKLRNFVRQTQTTIWLVAHPTKLKKDPRTGKYPIPTLYDVCGSSNFYNKTDNGLALWRDSSKTENLVKVCTVKVKNKNIGTNGREALFVWNRENGRFSPYVEPSRYDAEDENA